jgi:hypothetical protein
MSEKLKAASKLGDHNPIQDGERGASVTMPVQQTQALKLGRNSRRHATQRALGSFPKWRRRLLFCSGASGVLFRGGRKGEIFWPIARLLVLLIFWPVARLLVRVWQFAMLDLSMLRAPAEACARNEKFEKQLELAGKTHGAYDLCLLSNGSPCRCVRQRENLLLTRI